MKTYQITLPDEFAEFVDRMIAEKHWDSVEELVMHGLSQVQVELAGDEVEDKEALRKAVQIGIEQADRGELIEGSSVFRRLREKLEAARKQPT